VKLSLTRAARTDILHQYEYYVEQAPSNVPARFIVAVEETFAQLLTMPTMGSPKRLKNKHLAGLRSFCFSIYPKRPIFRLSAFFTVAEILIPFSVID
jgi:plasmid stabilization system protein ParE